MVPTLATALVAIALSIPRAHAQDDNDSQYTVWSSVVFARTGERTPKIIGTDSSALTTLGQQQQHDAGTFFRERYISPSDSDDGLSVAPISGLSANEIENLQLYILALDQQYNAASAQAFMQGFYPPYSLSSNGSGTREVLDPTGVLANNTYVSIEVKWQF